MSSLVLSGDTSGTVSLSVPAVAGSNTLTIQAGTGTNSMNTLATAVPSTSGTSIDFTGLPSWVKKITVMFSGVSTNGTSLMQVQIGAGSVANTGYASGAWTSNTLNANSTTGFVVSGVMLAAYTFDGVATLVLLNSSTGLWSFSSMLSGSTLGINSMGAGSKTLSGTLDRVRVTTVGGTDTFDAGSINILYEG